MILGEYDKMNQEADALFSTIGSTMFILSICFFILIFLHILISISIYRISKININYSNGILCYVPILNVFVLSSIVKKCFNKKSINIVSIIFIAMALLSYSFLFVLYIYSFYLLFYVYKLISKKYITYFILSVMSVGVLVPFILFLNRNKTLKPYNEDESVFKCETGNIVILENDWILIEHEGGYRFFLKTEFNVKKEPLTILIDNYSSMPLGIYSYDSNKLKLTDGFNELYKSEIKRFDDYNLTEIKTLFSDELIGEVMGIISEIKR